MDASLKALLNPVTVRRLVDTWLEEDGASLDPAGFVVGSSAETAILLAKADGVLAGKPFVDAIFDALGCAVNWSEGFVEGDWIEAGRAVAHVTGPASALLRGERVALNCLCRASGVATLARKAVERAARAPRAWMGRIAGTRKTTPGFRAVEKYALVVGGADSHRYDLGAMVMLKDNHVWSVGDVGKAIAQCRKVTSFSVKVEVECRSVQDALDAAGAGADVVMLDNFTPQAALAASRMIKAKYPNVLVEVSGGITLENLQDYVGPDIDVISMSQLTQGYPCVDFSLKVLREGHDPHNPLVTSIQGAAS